MQVAQFVEVLVLFTVLSLCNARYVTGPCIPCTENCLAECPIETLKRHIIRGPGEICGGLNNFYGVCEEGLHCSCNKCTGCTVNRDVECYTNENCRQIRLPQYRE